MSTLNRVLLVGNLGRDPEVRQFQNGGKVCNLRVATSETWKDKNTGEKREKTEWHSVAVTQEHSVNFLERFARKGSKVIVEGKLQTRKWQDQSGADRYSTEIVVAGYDGTIRLAGDPRGDQGGGGGQGGDQGGGGYGGNQGGGSGGQSQGGQGGGSQDLDDEIPF